MPTEIDATVFDDDALINIDGVLLSHPEDGVVSGTGGFQPFLRQNASDGTTTGFNTDDPAATANNNSGNLDMDASWTQALLLGDLPIVQIGGVSYFEIRLDLNEPNSTQDPSVILLGLTELQLYTSASQATLGDYNLATAGIRAFDAVDGFNLVYDLDGGSDGDVTVILTDGPSGSGNDDYSFYVPVSMFGDYDPADNFTLYAQFGPTPPEEATFEEWRIQKTAQVNGVKFNDEDSDGIRDAGEDGLEGFVMYIDANGNNVLDLGEITDESDADGVFHFYGLIAGTYVIREILSEDDLSAAVKSQIGYDPEDYLPPDGFWSLTTGTGGDHSFSVVTSGSDLADVTVLVGNHELVPSISIVKDVHDVDGNTVSPVVTAAGNVVNYTIAITNTGDITLTGLLTEDQVEALGETSLAPVESGGFNTGDTNMNGAFDPDETWNFTASYTVTQDDIDDNGGGDGILSNIARATTNQTAEVEDPAEVPIEQDPLIQVVKEASGYGDCADTVGEIITYTYTVTNEGNVTLENVDLSDDFSDGVPTYVSGDDGDGLLEIGESWTYTAQHIVTQDDIDNNGNYDSDDPADGVFDVLRNVATVTGDSVATGAQVTDDDDAIVEVCQDPAIQVVKEASGYGDCADTVGEIITYTYTVTNEGNVTLENVDLSDDFSDGVPTYVSGDDGDGLLEIGESWSYTAQHIVTQEDIDNNGNYDSDDPADGINDVLRNVATVTGDAVTTGEEVTDDDDAIVEVCQDPAIQVVKEASGYGDCADTVGEIITYTYTVTNEGNVTLENVDLSDDFSDGVPTYVSGDDGDGLLEIGESWSYTAQHIVTQEDIDNNGNYDSDDDGMFDVLRNVATVTGDAVTTGEEVTDDDDAIVEVCQDPAIQVVKEASGYGDCADTVGEIITYTYTVTNEGNVSLENVDLSDDFSDGVPTYVSGDDGDGLLEIGESWSYTAQHIVTQEDLDSGGNFDSDDPADGINDVLRNVATVTGDAVTTGEEVTDDDDAIVPVCQDPLIDLEKLVSVDSTDGTDGTFTDSDTEWGDQNVNIGDPVWFKVTLDNTGNVTLTDVDVVDLNTTGGLPGVEFELMEDGVLTADAIANHGATLDGDTDGDGDLDVDETWTITYSQAFDPGNHVNTATVTTDEGATDNDAAHYFSLINEGPGVRTPGFWQNPNNGGQFWDGIADNEKNAGEDCFADGELLYPIDSNGDDIIDAGVKGLLLGDWNQNGIEDGTEDTLFVSYDAAQILINASQKEQQDGRFMLGRDVVATWLNYLAGNEIGEIDGDANDDPKEAIQGAIDFLQTYGDTADNGILTGGNGKIVWEGAAVKTNSAPWQNGGSDLHGDLDEYNNSGWIDGVQYAHDCDDEDFAMALHIVNLI